MPPPVRVIHIANPLECRIIRRLNRFVLEISLKGNRHRAHINNTGRLEEFLVEGRRGFCLRNERPGKTSYRLFSIKEEGLGAIIDTQLQMRAFESALAMGLLPSLAGCSILKRNVRLGASLIDYSLNCGGREAYLEVKSAALRDGECASYPDCPSPRGRRHINELTNHAKNGGRAGMLFIGALPGVKCFRPNNSADPDLCELLVEARRAGVEINAIGIFYHPEDSFLHLFNPALEIKL